MCRKTLLLWLFTGILAAAAPLRAQDDFEIQVYGSDTVPKAFTMFELHSNFAHDTHAVHETVEITHGFAPWFETGFYIFTTEGQGKAWKYDGSHIRPRVRVPESWGWPVGVSLSSEFGWADHEFSWELRPIVDETAGRWYAAFNPALEDGRHFAPAVNVKYDVTPRLSAGFEYYGAEHSQQIYPAIDLNLGPDWEFNAGIGLPLTHDTEGTIFKVILGRRVGDRSFLRTFLPR
ncbi:MAG TPA: hypothetical protein VKH35_07575 [Thermoanaerobaculia bacterium]|nr:hypothetical protein [Thermoanaerobaculia bacterium]